MKKIQLPTKQILGLIASLATLPLITLGTGSAGDRYHQSTGEAIDDHAVSTRVKSALSNDPQYKYQTVEVRTFKGTVQLSGFVDTKAQKSRAGEIVKGIAGVRSLENNITVKE